MRRTGILPIVIAFMSALVAVQAQAGLISEKSELQMGKDGAKQIESQYKVSSNKQLTAEIVEIGKKLAAKCSRPSLPWQFKVLETKDVNAVSVPGYVYVFSGLIDFVKNDKDALAGVIGHEIGHTCGRHAAKSVEKQLTYGLAIQLLLKKGNAQDLGSIAANLALLGYSRKDEYQADKFGVDYVYAAGYNPEGMIKFFEQLKQKEGKDSGTGLQKYFATHPPTADRIKRVKDEITALKQPMPVAQPQTTPPVQPQQQTN
jgi:beta-barrel assembly-enhancing protease